MVLFFLKTCLRFLTMGTSKCLLFLSIFVGSLFQLLLPSRGVVFAEKPLESLSHLPSCKSSEVRHLPKNDLWMSCIQTSHGLRRIPLVQLQHAYLDPETDGSSIAANDTEGAISKTSSPKGGRAFALLPNRPLRAPYYVLLHLHGYNHQTVNGSPLPTPRVEYDQFAKQISQSGHAQDVVALFPQADPDINFFQTPPNSEFQILEFLKEVSLRVKLKPPAQKQPLILIAHSAGGRFLNEVLPSLAHASVKIVAFLEAINGPNELSQLQNYLQAQIQTSLERLQHESNPTEWKKYVASLPRYYFYYSAASAYYGKLYKQLQLFLDKEFAREEKRLTRKQARLLQLLRGRYHMNEVPKEIPHSDLMRSGMIRRLLQTLPSLHRT